MPDFICNGTMTLKIKNADPVAINKMETAINKGISFEYANKI